MKKIIVDQSKCIGCGACVGVDDKHFNFNDQGLSVAINQENQDSDALKEAIAGCPVGAISIDDVNADDDKKDDKCDCENCHCDHCDK
jgi:ferredoxin